MGGDRATFDRVFPLLTILGRRILHTGPLGSASTLKVMTNYLATANLLTCCEALVTMKAAGLDLATTYEAIRISSGTSFVHETESQMILNGCRDINFTMDLAVKDLGFAMAYGRDLGVPLALAGLTSETFDRARADVALVAGSTEPLRNQAYGVISRRQIESGVRYRF